MAWLGIGGTQAEVDGTAEMTSAAPVELLRLVDAAAIPVWLDGGWGVAALLQKQTRMLRPLLPTFSIVMLTTPMFGLLAAVAHAQGGTIVNLGLLSAALGWGALVGALVAGWRGEGPRPARLYTLLGLVAAVSMATFAWLPVSYLSALPLAAVGCALFSQAVWNTSRVRLVADAAYQARLQALTTMTFTLAGAAGQAWGGVAIDCFGMPSVLVAAALLAAISALGLLRSAQGDRELPFEKEVRWTSQAS